MGSTGMRRGGARAGSAQAEGKTGRTAPIVRGNGSVDQQMVAGGARAPVLESATELKREASRDVAVGNGSTGSAAGRSW